MSSLIAILSALEGKRKGEEGRGRHNNITSTQQHNFNRKEIGERQNVTALEFNAPFTARRKKRKRERKEEQ